MGKSLKQLLEESIDPAHGWCAIDAVVKEVPEFCDQHGDPIFNTNYNKFKGTLCVNFVDGFYRSHDQAWGYCALSFKGKLVGMIKYEGDSPEAIEWVSIKVYRHVVTFLRLINTEIPENMDKYVWEIENLNQLTK